VKQKWLKEDWEFFKQQRKILEQEVLKNNPKASVPHRFVSQHHHHIHPSPLKLIILVEKNSSSKPLKRHLEGLHG
jgi:hypothetical protein